MKVGDYLTIENGPRSQRVRVLEIRACAWCTRPFPLTTRTPAPQRARRRFCTHQCSNRAGGITHDEAWRRRMTQASIVTRQRLALERALGMMAGATTPEAIAAAVTRIYRHAYRNGWQAGRKYGTRAAQAKFDRELTRLNLSVAS